MAGLGAETDAGRRSFFAAPLPRSSRHRLRERLDEQELTFGAEPVQPSSTPWVSGCRDTARLQRIGDLLSRALGELLDLFHTNSRVSSAINYYELLVHEDDPELTDRMLEIRKLWSDVYPAVRRADRRARLLRPDLVPTGDSFRVVEVNALLPGGIVVADELGALFAGVEPFRSQIADGTVSRFPYMDAYLRVVTEAGEGMDGKAARTVAMLLPDGLPPLEESRGVAGFLRSRGYRVLTAASPDEFRFHDDRLFLSGERVGTYMELDPRKPELTNDVVFHAHLADSVASGNLVVYPFRYQHPLSYKSVLAILTDESYWPLFDDTDALRELRPFLPWTRRCVDAVTTYRGEKVDFVEFCEARRADLVVKYADVSFSNYTVPGMEVSADEWKRLIGKLAGSRFFVVQEYVHSEIERLSPLRAGRRRPGRLVVSPFSYAGDFVGPFVRFGEGPVVVMSRQTGLVCPSFRLN